MAITVNLRYTGKNGAAQAFAREMISSGTVEKIRSEKGNLRYEYYLPFGEDDSIETILLIDSWENQEAIDLHHATPMMKMGCTQHFNNKHYFGFFLMINVNNVQRF